MPSNGPASILTIRSPIAVGGSIPLVLRIRGIEGIGGHIPLLIEADQQVASTLGPEDGVVVVSIRSGLFAVLDADAPRFTHGGAAEASRVMAFPARFGCKS
jgi:hypothetical protein